MKKCGFNSSINVNRIGNDYEHIKDVYSYYNLFDENPDEGRMHDIINNKKWSEKAFDVATKLSANIGSVVDSFYVAANGNKKIEELTKNIDLVGMLLDENIKLHKPVSELKLNELLFLLSYNEGEILSTENISYINNYYDAHYNPNGKFLYVQNGDVKKAYEEIKEKHDINVVIYRDKSKLFDRIPDAEAIESKIEKLGQLKNVLNAIFSLTDNMTKDEYNLLEYLSEYLYKDIFNNLTEKKKLNVLLHYVNILFRFQFINNKNVTYLINEFNFAGIYDHKEMLSCVKFYKNNNDFIDFILNNFDIKDKILSMPVHYDERVTYNFVDGAIAFDTKRNVHIAIVNDNMTEDMFFSLSENIDSVYLNRLRFSRMYRGLNKSDKFYGFLIDLLERANVNFEILSNSNFIRTITNLGYVYVGQKAFYLNGTIYLDENINEKTLLHEILHPFIMSYIRMYPEQAAEILNTLRMLFDDLDQRYNQLINFYSDENIAAEELLTEVLTDIMYKKYNDEKKDSFIKRVIKNILDFIKGILGISSDITLETTVSEIIEYIESENTKIKLIYDDIARFDLSDIDAFKYGMLAAFYDNIEFNHIYRTIDKEFSNNLNDLSIDIANIGNMIDNGIININEITDANKVNKINSLNTDIKKLIQNLNSKLSDLNIDIEKYLKGNLLITKAFDFEYYFKGDIALQEYFKNVSKYNSHIKTILVSTEEVIKAFAERSIPQYTNINNIFENLLFRNTITLVPLLINTTFNIAEFANGLVKYVKNFKDIGYKDSDIFGYENIMYPFLSNLLVLQYSKEKLWQVKDAFNNILDLLYAVEKEELRQTIDDLRKQSEEAFGKVSIALDNATKENSVFLKDLFVDFLYTSYNTFYKTVIERFNETLKNLDIKQVDATNVSIHLKDDVAAVSDNVNMLSLLINFLKMLVNQKKMETFVFGQLKEEDIKFFFDMIDRVINVNNKLSDIKENLFSVEEKERFLFVATNLINSGVVVSKEMMEIYITNSFSNDEIRALLSSIDNNNMIVSIFTRFLKIKDVENKMELPALTNELYNNVIDKHNLKGARSNLSSLLDVEEKSIFILDNNNIKRTENVKVYVFKSMHKNYVRRYSILRKEIEELHLEIASLKSDLENHEVSLFNNLKITENDKDIIVNILKDALYKTLKVNTNYRIERVINKINEIILEEYNVSMIIEKIENIRNKVLEALKDEISSIDENFIDALYLYVNFMITSDIETYLKYLDKNGMYDQKSKIESLYKKIKELYDKLDKKYNTLSKIYSERIDSKKTEEKEMQYYVEAINDTLLLYNYNFSITKDGLIEILNKEYDELDENEKLILKEYIKLKEFVEGRMYESIIIYNKLKAIEKNIENIYKLNFDINKFQSSKDFAVVTNAVYEEYRKLLRQMLSLYEETFNNEKIDIAIRLFKSIRELKNPKTQDVIFKDNEFRNDILKELILNNFLERHNIAHNVSIDLDELIMLLEMLERKMRMMHKIDKTTGENLYYKIISDRYEELYEFYLKNGVPEYRLEKLRKMKKEAISLYKALNNIGFLNDAFEFSSVSTYNAMDVILENINKIDKEISEETISIEKELGIIGTSELNELKDKIFKGSSKRLRPIVVIQMLKNIRNTKMENPELFAFIDNDVDEAYDAVLGILASSAFFYINENGKLELVETNENILNREIKVTYSDYTYNIKISQISEGVNPKYKINISYDRVIELPNGNDVVIEKKFNYVLDSDIFLHLALTNKAYLPKAKTKLISDEPTFVVKISSALTYTIPTNETSYIFSSSKLGRRFSFVADLIDKYFIGYGLGNRYVIRINDDTNLTPKIIGLTVESNNNFLPIIFKNEIFRWLVLWTYENLSLIEDDKTREGVKEMLDNALRDGDGINYDKLTEEKSISILHYLTHVMPKSFFFRFLKDIHNKNFVIGDYTNIAEAIANLLDKDVIKDSEFYNEEFFKLFISTDKTDFDNVEALLDTIIWFIDFQHKYARTSGMLYLEFPRYNIKMSEIFTNLRGPVSPLSKIYGWAMIMLGIDNTDESFYQVYRSDARGMYDIGLTHLPLYGHHHNPIEKTSTNAYSLYYYIVNVLNHNTLIDTLPMALIYSYMFNIESMVGKYAFKDEYAQAEYNPFSSILPKIDRDHFMGTRSLLNAMFKKYYFGVRYFERKNVFLKALFRVLNRLLVYSAFALINVAKFIAVVSNFIAQQITTLLRLSSYAIRHEIAVTKMAKTHLDAFIETCKAYKLKASRDFEVADIKRLYIILTLLGDLQLQKFLMRGIRFSPKHISSSINFIYLPKEASELYSRLYAFLTFAKGKKFKIKGDEYTLFDIIKIDNDGYIYSTIDDEDYQVTYDDKTGKYIIGKGIARILLQLQNVTTKSSLALFIGYESPYSENWLFKLTSVMRTYILPYLNEIIGVNRIDPDTGNIILPALHYPKPTSAKRLPKFVAGFAEITFSVIKNIMVTLYSLAYVLFKILISPLRISHQLFFSKNLKKKSIYEEIVYDNMHYYTITATRIAIIYLVEMMAFFIILNTMKLFDIDGDDDDDKPKDNLGSYLKEISEGKSKSEVREYLSSLAEEMASSKKYDNFKIAGKQLKSLSFNERLALAYAYVNALLVANNLRNNEAYQQFLNDYKDYYRYDKYVEIEGDMVNKSDVIRRLVPNRMLYNGYDQLIDYVTTQIIEKSNYIGKDINFHKISENARDLNNKLMDNIYLLGSTLYSKEAINPLYFVNDKTNTAYYNKKLFLSKTLLRTHNQLSAYSNPILEFGQMLNMFNNVSAYQNIAGILGKAFQDAYEKDDISHIRGASKMWTAFAERFIPFYNSPASINVRSDLDNIELSAKWDILYWLMSDEEGIVVPNKKITKESVE